LEKGEFHHFTELLRLVGFSRVNMVSMVMVWVRVSIRFSVSLVLVIGYDFPM